MFSRHYYKGAYKLTSSEPVTFGTGNPAVVQVREDGTVTAVGAGTAVITADSVQGGKHAACTVTVRYAWWQQLIRIFLFGRIWY